MPRLPGLTLLIGFLGLAAAACHEPRPVAECTNDAPIGPYAGALPPPSDAVWYVPPPYYDDTPTGGGYYDDGSGSYDDDTSYDDDGWDTPDDSSSSSSSSDDSSSSSSDDSSSDDGWDDPDPARRVETQSVHPKTMPGEVVTVAGCFVCQLVCTSAAGAYSATGASAHSYQSACRVAEHRLERNFGVTSCMTVTSSRIGDHP